MNPIIDILKNICSKFRSGMLQYTNKNCVNTLVLGKKYKDFYRILEVKVNREQLPSILDYINSTSPSCIDRNSSLIAQDFDSIYINTIKAAGVSITDINEFIDNRQ